jgi:hypothetical protein
MEDEAAQDVEIEAHADHLEARFLGSFTVDRFKRQVEAAVRACRARSLGRLLIDVTLLQAKLTTIDRYEISSHGASEAYDLKVALFSLPELIDPKKFGVMVARNRGMNVDIFTDRESALTWLLATKDG